MRSLSSATDPSIKAPKSSSGTASSETCILVNPKSFRIHAGAKLQQICSTAKAAGVSLHVVHHPEEISAALTSHRQDPPRRLIIIGGDGTVQAALAELVETPPARLPFILVLGGGRTNFTARDLGTHATPNYWLQRALNSPEDFRTEHRMILSLQQQSTRKRLHGFFIAGALVDHVIRDCHDYRTRHQGWLRTGHPSSAWRVIQLAVTGLFGRSNFLPPHMRIDAGRLGSLDQTVRILIMSSLEHQRGLINPYDSRGSGSLRLTAVTQSAEGFWRRLPFLLRGRLGSRQTPDAGYLSGRTERVVIQGLQSVCIDGQECEFLPHEDVLVKAGPTFSFMVP
ncbi:MAG TPA: diacylglycerol kinase family protein [Wenzhouxiangella sp.]|nr:diacylglycerol kinase family protein [Wenzhouxiangella sp.]